MYDGARHVPYASVSDATAAHSMTVTSASKAFNLAGLKCAQVVTSNHADAARWRERRVFEVAGPTPIGIAASTVAYAEGGPWLDALVGVPRRQPSTGSASCSRRSFRACSGTARRRPSSPGSTARRSASTTRRASSSTARSVAVSDGPPFGPGCEQFVRLNVATSRALLERIVGAMGAAVR